MHHENETKNKLLELMLELTAQSCYEMSDLADTYYRMSATGELYHEAEQPDFCTIAGLRFGAWRVYQQHVEGRTDCTLEQFRNLTFTQWRDCVLALAWQMPKAYLLHFECVAVAVAYRYLLLGTDAFAEGQSVSYLKSDQADEEDKTCPAAESRYKEDILIPHLAGSEFRTEEFVRDHPMARENY